MMQKSSERTPLLATSVQAQDYHDETDDRPVSSNALGTINGRVKWMG